MKKFLAFALVVCLMFAAVACSTTKDPQSTTTPAADPSKETTPAANDVLAASTKIIEEETKTLNARSEKLTWDGNVDSLGPILQDVYKTGKIDVGYTAQKPPQQFHLTIDGNDNVIGFEVWMSDLIAARVADYLGVNVEQAKNIYTVQGGLAALQANQLDCMPTLSPTPERRENYDFSQSYHWSLQTVGYLESRAGEAIWDPAKELEGVTVAVVKGTTNESGLMLQYPKCTVLSLEKQSDVLVAVLTGKADAFLMNEKTAILYCAANPELTYDLKLSYNVDVEKDPGAAYCVPKGNEDFVALIDEVITQIMADGTFTNLENEAIALCDNSEVLEAYMAENVEK